MRERDGEREGVRERVGELDSRGGFEVGYLGVSEAVCVRERE